MLWQGLVCRYVFYVNSSRIGVEKQRLHEEAVAEKAAVARAEGHKGDTDEMMVEEAAPIRLGYILNASRAEEFNQWMAFEAGLG